MFFLCDLMFCLVDVAKFFQNMNEQGIKKSMEMIEVISKVPEYQTDMEWAYRTDSPKEASMDTEEKNEKESLY